MFLQKADVTVRFFSDNTEVKYKEVMVYQNSEYLVICNDPETLVQLCMYDSEFWNKKYEKSIDLYFIDIFKRFVQNTDTILYMSVESFLQKNVVVFDTQNVNLTFNSVKKIKDLFI